MSENAEKKENRKLCPFGWTHCAKEVCEWWLEFANSCAIPLTACILADSTICQNVWERGPRWTEQEIKDAKNIIRMFGEDRYPYVIKTMDGLPYLSDDLESLAMYTINLEPEIFPSLKCGETVKITNIIGGNT